MIMSNQELTELIAARRELDKRFKEKEDELREFRQETLKKAHAIEFKLAKECEHKFIRDSYAYAPLYCKFCFLEQAQVSRLLR